MSPAVLQAKAADYNTVPPYNSTFTNPVTLGSRLACCISCDHPSLADATVSDNRNGAWVPISASKETIWNMTQWYILPGAAAAGSTTVNATGSGYDGIIHWIAELSGVSGVVNTGHADSNTTSGTVTTSLTTTVDGCLILGAIRDAGSGTIDGAWTMLADDLNGDPSEYKIQATAGTILVPFNNPTAVNWAISAIALEPLITPPPVFQPHRMPIGV